MANIHKFTLYFVDPNGEWFGGDILEELQNSRILPSVKLGSYESKEFEWDDDLIVNRVRATPQEVEEFYNKL